MDKHSDSPGALAGLRVVDLTQMLAGPICTQVLADHGAQVTKVESLTGDGIRSSGPFRPDDALRAFGGYFQSVNRNKSSIALDLKQAQGRELLVRLVKDADVVVENFRPDVKVRLGIDYAALSREHPGLVYASISGFGQDGPLANRPGFDQIAQGMGGLMSVTGLPGQGPMRVGIPIADLCAGIFAAQGILVALLERESSGRGQFVHTSLLESMIAMMDFQTSRWLIDGEVATQAGNFHPTSIPTGVYKARDGYMNIAVFGSRIWERFCAILGAPEWVADPRYHDKAARSVHRDALNAEIERRLATQDRAFWVRQFNEGGVACGLINDLREVFEEPQVRHLGIVKEVQSRWHGPQRLVGQPVQLQRTPSTVARAAPRRGEHTEEILGEMGLGAAEIARLKSAGAF